MKYECTYVYFQSLPDRIGFVAEGRFNQPMTGVWRCMLCQQVLGAETPEEHAKEHEAGR